jgi:hypothetical protein
MVYKSAFRLNGLHNAVFGKFYIPASKFMLLTFYINLPLFGVFCYWDKLDLPSISTLVVMFVTAVSLLVSCSHVMSAIYDISSQFQRNMKEKIKVSGDKIMRKVWLRDLRSCQLVRCQIWNFYHMERKAKLTMINTLVNGFVFLVVQRNLE